DLTARECAFTNDLRLQNARITSLNLESTCIKTLSAAGLITKHSVYLSDRFKAQGGVDLADAQIGGGLFCKNGEFTGAYNKPALNAVRAKIQGSVDLSRGFKANGSVSF